MKRAPIALLVSFLLAGAAWAITTKLITLESPHRLLSLWTFHKGVKIGASGTTITNSPAGTLAYDFPALSGPAGELNTTCALSGTVTVTGAKFGDVCVLGIDQAPVNEFGTLVPYVTATNQAKVQACAVGLTDGGAFDMPDASYTVRCFSP